MGLIARLVPLAAIACSMRASPPTFDPAASDWTLEALPVPAGTSDVAVRAVAGSGPSDVWVLANASRGGAATGLAFHFDGASWSAVPIPGRATTAIAVVGPRDVWTVGRYGTAAHWDGAAFTEEKIPGVAFDLVGVAAWSDGSVFAAPAVNGVIARQDGRWSRLRPPELDGTSTYALWGPSKAIGLLVAVNREGEATRVARYSGRWWTVEEAGHDGVVVIAGSAPDDVWAFGARERAFHFDGASWREIPTGARDLIIGAFAGGKDDAWAVGASGQILRWDGQAWRPSRSGTGGRVWSVYAPPGMRPLAASDVGLLRLR